MMEITSLQNPKVKLVGKLRDRRGREKTKLFLIEGYREITRAFNANVKINTFFFCPEVFLGENENLLLERMEKKGVELCKCTKEVFEKLSYRDRPDGLLAIAPQKPTSLSDLKIPASRDPFILIAEAIEKPGNLGTILRSADAAGVDAVIVCDRCTDIFNPNVVRASVGTLFTVPVAEATTDELISFLKDKRIPVVAATPHAEKEFTETELTGPVAIFVGTEQLGITEKWLKQAEIHVSIPMFGVADSLNVATATTLLLYEVLRQRKYYGSPLL